jgi:hypothetical protein
VLEDVHVECVVTGVTAVCPHLLQLRVVLETTDMPSIPIAISQKPVPSPDQHVVRRLDRGGAPAEAAREPHRIGDLARTLPGVVPLSVSPLYVKEKAWTVVWCTVTDPPGGAKTTEYHGRKNPMSASTAPAKTTRM